MSICKEFYRFLMGRFYCLEFKARYNTKKIK